MTSFDFGSVLADPAETSAEDFQEADVIRGIAPAGDRGNAISPQQALDHSLRRHELQISNAIFIDDGC